MKKYFQQDAKMVATAKAAHGKVITTIYGDGKMISSQINTEIPGNWKISIQETGNLT